MSHIFVKSNSKQGKLTYSKTPMYLKSAYWKNVCIHQGSQTDGAIAKNTDNPNFHINIRKSMNFESKAGLINTLSGPGV